jgi:phosphonate transport system permease protein
MWSPDLSPDFLRLTLREAGVTVSYALLGTFVALIIGLIGSVILTERIWTPLAGPVGRARWGWMVGRFAFAVPRSMHEVVFGLVLVNLLGLNPLVAILAIGIPFGAVTAKVFSELLDEVPREAERALRSAGSGRLTGLIFGVFPYAFGDLLSYAFYRFECSIRSAAVLGIVGAGGIGFQLALSFQSLRYEQMWTMIWALIIISGIADRWSSVVRHRRNSAAVEMHVRRDQGSPRLAPKHDRLLLGSSGFAALMVPVAFWWLEVDITSLWDARARRLTRDLAADAWPPTLGDGGLGGLVSDSVDTIVLAILSIAMAWSVASLVAFIARRPPRRLSGATGRILATIGLLTRFGLLVARSVPPPVWAFIVVFVLFPGIWPGAVALALYNLGVLGRLQSEVLENLDQKPADALRAAGAGNISALAYATLPAVSPRFVSLGLYRWEVAIRETVIVGVVGAAGLGRRLVEQTSAFDYNGMFATILALLVITVAVDLASASIRRTLR